MLNYNIEKDELIGGLLSIDQKYEDANELWRILKKTEEKNEEESQVVIRLCNEFEQMLMQNNSIKQYEALLEEQKYLCRMEYDMRGDFQQNSLKLLEKYINVLEEKIKRINRDEI